jgi:hypothetical protein
MKTETQEMESNLALAWFEGIYTQEQAQLSAELQSLSFENVANQFAGLYIEESERVNYE